MITQAIQSLPRETVRVEFLRLITEAVMTGRDLNELKNCSSMSISQVGSAVRLSVKAVTQTIQLYEIFVDSFGLNALEEGSQNVILNRNVLGKLLRQPAATRLASEISGVSEARIQAYINKI